MTARCGLTMSGVLLAAVFVQAAAAAGPTAKAAVVSAAADARKWQPDAALTSISSTSAMPDGTADSWTYTFYSPKSTKFLTVTVSGGKSATLEVRQGVTDPVGPDFIDSDKAMQEARANGLRGKTPSMALNFMGNIKQPTSFWTVTGGFASTTSQSFWTPRRESSLCAPRFPERRATDAWA